MFIRCFFCAQPVGLPFGYRLHKEMGTECCRAHRHKHGHVYGWKQARECFLWFMWLNMGLSLLFPAASVEAESTVTSLLNDSDRKPISILLVGNMVTILAPAGVCYLAGCAEQSGFVLGNFNPFNLLALMIKPKV